MSPETMYLKTLIKVNKGNTGNNIALDKNKFLVIANEQKDKWLERKARLKDSIEIDSIHELVKEKEYFEGDTKPNYIEYELEDDFFQSILVKTKAKKDTCKGTVYSREVKNQNKNLLEFDENQRPDFEWEWTFHTVQGNKLRVYKSDFDITSATLEYYQLIPEITMAGTVNIKGEQVAVSKGIDIISDHHVDEIIDMIATEFMRDTENTNGVQLGQNREKS